MSTAGFWTLASIAVSQASVATHEPCLPSEVCGQIVDNEATPVPYAEIEIIYEGSSDFTLTDGEGRFAIRKRQGVEVSKIAVTVIGFVAAEIAYPELLAAGGRLSLSPEEEISEENSIVVVARARSRPFASRSIETTEIVSDPFALADVLLAVSGLSVSTNVNNSADLQLRGSAVGLARTYFNDVPLYEIVRGSSVDQTTRVFSIFDPRVLENVEVYPTNPPAYLANSAAGAVRALPQSDANAPTSALIGLSGLKVASSQPLFDGGAAQLYLSIEDASPLLEVNPDLRQILTASQNQSLGIVASIPTESGGDLTVFGALDFENTEFPLRILNISGQSDSDRTRAFGIVTWETPLENDRMKLDAAFTHTRNTLTFGEQSTSARNNYIYINGDLAGDLFNRAIEYRAGLTFESFDLNGEGQINLGPQFDQTAPQDTTGAASYLAAFAFITSELSQGLTLQLGTRQAFAGDAEVNAVYSAGLTYEFPDRKHRVILSLGQYGAFVPPEIPVLQPVILAESRQVSLDYLFDDGPVRMALGAYAKTDRVADRDTDIVGFDAELDVAIANGLDLSLRFASSDHDVDGARGDNDLAYQFRAIARSRPNRFLSVTGALTYRSGAVFTPVVDVGFGEGGASFPIFSANPNEARLDDFLSLDLNISHVLNVWPGKTKPIGILAVSNLLDRANEARAVYTPDFSSEQRVFFGPRVFFVGLVFNF